MKILIPIGLGLVIILSGCASDTYRRQHLGGTNEVVRFTHRALFVNSKTTKFALDNLTARGTRNGLNFGSNEQDVAVEGLNAFFNGLNALMMNAAKLGASGGASSLLPGSGAGSASTMPHVTAPVVVTPPVAPVHP